MNSCTCPGSNTPITCSDITTIENSVNINLDRISKINSGPANRCATGTILLNGVCQPCSKYDKLGTASKTNNALYNGCYCKNGSVNIDGKCVICPSNSSNINTGQMITNPTGCFCNIGYRTINGTGCSMCPPGSTSWQQGNSGKLKDINCWCDLDYNLDPTETACYSAV